MIPAIVMLFILFVFMTVFVVLIFRKAYYYEVKFFKGDNIIYTTVLILIYLMMSFNIFKYILSHV